jgi:hypothetical protein
MTVENFQVQGLNTIGDIADMQRSAEKMHQEVLELIAALSDGASSENTSSVCPLAPGESCTYCCTEEQTLLKLPEQVCV